MSVHSIQRKRRRDPAKTRYKSLGSHEEFVARICRSLYYAQLPTTERLSLPITEVAVELFSEVKSRRSLDRLGLDEASYISRNACVSPASLVLALLYLERLKISSPEYLDSVGSAQLFLVSSMVASKFLNDDGEKDEVLNCDWAVSADIPLAQLNKLEKDFLAAINWEVFVESDEFWKRLEMLEEQIALRQATKRGFFTYTDLLSLLGYIDSLSLAHTLISVGAVCLTAYAAGVVSMVGSTVLVSTLQRTASSLASSVQRPAVSTTVDSNRTFPPHTITTTDDLLLGCLDECGDISSLAVIDLTDPMSSLNGLTDFSYVAPSSLQGPTPSNFLPLSNSGEVEDVGREKNCSDCCVWFNQSLCHNQPSWLPDTSNYWWLKEESSLSYILGSMVKPLYSYVELVTH